MTGGLTHRNAIITGAGSGIGAEIARLFGAEGARVALLDRDGAAVAAVAAGLQDAGVDAIAHTMEVTDPPGVAAAFARCLEHFGGAVHVLVNNAGVAEFASVEESSLEAWARIMAVNATGPFLCSQAVLPAMRAQGGAIIHIASIAGLIGIPRMAAYCASKAAVIGLTRQMAVDYTPLGIRVNCLCPGRVAETAIDRRIMEMDTPAATAAKLAKYPMGRFGRPEEIAQAALFLASDAASYVSGAVLPIDGGFTAQ
jgi:NAD(P)-dependent dehydrogenase (short-subunit alcohol dehydrogenase family)